MSPVTPWRAIAIIGLGTLVAPLDSAVNIAFPSITSAFDIPVRDIQWVITMFGLAQTSLTLVFGKVGDRHGHQRVFVAGLMVSALALILCATAASYPALVLMRVLQGVGAGLVMACGPALISFAMPPDQRRRALAIYTILIGLGMCIGPLIGGLLVQLAGWPAVYWFRVPIALIALLLLRDLRGLEDHADLQAARALARTQPFDRSGALMLVLALALSVFVIVQLRDPALGHGSILLAVVVVVSAFAYLYQRGDRVANPVIRLRYFADRRFRDLQIAAIVIQALTFSLLLLVPYRLALWPGLSLAGSGVVLALFPAGAMLAGVLSTRLTRRISSTQLVWSGMSIAGFGLLACAGFSTSGWLLPTALAMLLTGIGLGLFQVGHLDATVSAMPVGERGVAGSLVSVGRVLGFSLSANLVMWAHDAMRGVSELPSDYGRSLLVAGAVLLIAAAVFGICHRQR